MHCAHDTRKLVALFIDNARVYSVWRDIYKDKLTSGRSSEGEGESKSGANVRLRTKCDSHATHPHTALFYTEPQALHWEGGALCWALWVFVSESLKRPPVNQQLYVSFVSLWLIKRFIHLRFGSSAEFPKRKNQIKEKSASQHKTSLPDLGSLSDTGAQLRSQGAIRKLFTLCCFAAHVAVSGQVASWRGVLLSTQEPIREGCVDVLVKGLKVTTGWSPSSQLHANCIIHAVLVSVVFPFISSTSDWKCIL